MVEADGVDAVHKLSRFTRRRAWRNLVLIQRAEASPALHQGSFSFILQGYYYDVEEASLNPWNCGRCIHTPHEAMVA